MKMQRGLISNVIYERSTLSKRIQKDKKYKKGDKYTREIASLKKTTILLSEQIDMWQRRKICIGKAYFNRYMIIPVYSPKKVLKYIFLNDNWKK